MKVLKSLTVAVLLAGFAWLLWPQQSVAGYYTVTQCEGAQHRDSSANYMSVNSLNPPVDVVAGCVPGGAGKLGLYQDRSDRRFSPGEGAQFIWLAPEQTRISMTSINAKLKDANGISAELIGFDGTTIVDVDQGVPHDGQARTSNWMNHSLPQTMVVARLVCHTSGSCGNNGSSTKAFMELTDARFQVQDLSAPTVNVSGELWNWGIDWAYHRGTAGITLQASDLGSGVADAWLEVNGLKVSFPAPSCPGDQGSFSTRFTPCETSLGRSLAIDSARAPFQEGVNYLRVCASDYSDVPASANRTCSETRGVVIDNQAPLPPVGLHSLQGSDWQAENGFSLRWSIPAGQVSPVIGAIYQLVDLETGEPRAYGYVAETNLEGIGPIEVPGAGAYRMRVAFLDSAGNWGEAAETIVRFDNRPPGNVEPEPASGWLSKDELPLQQEVSRADAGGPSGISGYAIAVSEDTPVPPCRSGICEQPEITLAGGSESRRSSIGGLNEGDYWVTAAAVSGARKSSLEPGSTIVQVDKTPPESSISGIPATWVNHPVTVTVSATDQLSGMSRVAGDDGVPATFIEADGYATYESPGHDATFSIATEGVTRVRYWAEDLAGNANDGRAAPDGEIHPRPSQASVRIDTAPPKAEFLRQSDPRDPELVVVRVSDLDSGVASVGVEMRQIGSGSEFTLLPTSGQEGQFTARIPSDELPAGSYELRARVVDRAGNEVLRDRTTTGEPMNLNLPLKQSSSLSAVFRESRASIRTGYESREYVEGRLSVNEMAMPNQLLTITETFDHGSRSAGRITEIHSDGDGRYRVRLGAGPGRKVQVSFGGSSQFTRAKSPALSLAVKGRVRLRLKPGVVVNGGVAKMRGSVGFRGALPPARGKLVAIQYFDPSRHKWRPVEVIRTTSKGTFKYRYRFRTITSPQKILFRAAALPEAGWPYLPAMSRPRPVIVYPKNFHSGKKEGS